MIAAHQQIPINNLHPPHQHLTIPENLHIQLRYIMQMVLKLQQLEQDLEVAFQHKLILIEKDQVHRESIIDINELILMI